MDKVIYKLRIDGSKLELLAKTDLEPITPNGYVHFNLDGVTYIEKICGEINKEFNPIAAINIDKEQKIEYFIDAFGLSTSSICVDRGEIIG